MQVITLLLWWSFPSHIHTNHLKYVQLIVCQVYYNKAIFLKIWAIPKAYLIIPFLGLKFFKGCQGPTRSSPGTSLFSPVLFYSHILLEHNLPLTYFIAFGHTISFCWEVLSFPISFETRLDRFGSSSNAFSYNLSGLPQLWVWLFFFFLFLQALQHFALIFHNLILIVCAYLNFRMKLQAHWEQRLLLIRLCILLQ